LECLDEDTVLAFVDGKLDASRSGEITTHLERCASCSDLVVGSAGGDPGRSRPLAEALSAPAALARGDTVGRYVILNLVGRGGMGEVYAAYDPQLDRRVALKLLHDTLLPNDASRIARQRLLREAKAIARLSHPNVVVVHDAGAIDDPVRGERVFVAMEFIEGETLSAWLAAAPRSWRAVREVFLAAGEGLAAAHEAGLVHRDFKPQNVMVARDGAVRVMDFGLASDTSDLAAGSGAPLELTGGTQAPTSHTVALTSTGVLLGTPLYMAPEQFKALATDARTDQFSFCVALYEALYGERPFPSESLPTLMQAVLAGRVREPPQRARVPAFLRRLLLRGLAVDAPARHASMRELLDVLRTDPLRRRRTALAAAAAVAGLVAAVVGVQRIATRGQRLCSGAAGKLEGVWDSGEGGARRSAIHGAFLATGRGFAEETWQRVAGLLDDYSHRWTALYTDSCEATHVRGDQSAEVLDLRTTCLEGAREALRALTDLLAHADGKVVAQAIDAARALPPLERCSDVAALREVVPPPDAAARTGVAALEKRLAEIKALRDTGQLKTALGKAKALADEARNVRYEPLLAEVLSIRSWLERESGDPTSAANTLEKGVWTALAAHRDDLAAEDAAQLVVFVAYDLSRPAEAEQWQGAAEALLRRLGPGHDRIAGWLHHDIGGAALARGDYRTAAAEYQLALSLKRKALPADHPDIGLTENNVALVDTLLNDGPAALAAADRGLAVYSAAYGADNPMLFNILDTRGEALELLGRYAEAEKDFRAAADRATELFGADHYRTAIALGDLGKVLLDEGRPSEALPILEKTVQIRERSDLSLENVAEARFALARALWETRQDRPRALALAAAGRDSYAKLPWHRKDFTEIDTWLADKGTSGRARTH
jgi:eukaryotic-like serine/threonine-protein kinase